MVMHRLVSDGQHAELIARAEVHYRAKRDAMLAALGAHMPPSVNWTRPEGGFFIWLKLPTRVPGASLLKRAIDQVNVAFVPGCVLSRRQRGKYRPPLVFTSRYFRDRSRDKKKARLPHIQISGSLT